MSRSRKRKKVDDDVEFFPGDDIEPRPRKKPKYGDIQQELDMQKQQIQEKEKTIASLESKVNQLAYEKKIMGTLLNIRTRDFVELSIVSYEGKQIEFSEKTYNDMKVLLEIYNRSIGPSKLEKYIKPERSLSGSPSAFFSPIKNDGMLDPEDLPHVDLDRSNR